MTEFHNVCYTNGHMTRQAMIKQASKYIFLIGLLVAGYFIYLRYGSVIIPRSQTPIATTPASTEKTEIKPLNAESLLHYSNVEREKAKIAPLTLSEHLNKSATVKVEDMIKDQYYDHVNPITNRPGHTYIYAYMPEECEYVGENLYRFPGPHDKSDVDYAKQVVEYWMKSQGNQEEAILDPGYTLVGFGIKDDFVVQHFCQLKK